MSKFKVGDRVRCVDDGLGEHSIKKGKIYTISFVGEDDPVTYLVGFKEFGHTEGEWFANRFERVEGFEIGDLVEVVDDAGNVRSYAGQKLTISQRICHEGQERFYRFEQACWGLYESRLRLVESGESQCKAEVAPIDPGIYLDQYEKSKKALMKELGKNEFGAKRRSVDLIQGDYCPHCDKGWLKWEAHKSKSRPRHVLRCTGCGQYADDDLNAADALAVDPNADMIAGDQKESKRREFEAVVRSREFERRKAELRQSVSSDLEEFWDGEHLSNAIDKTVGTAPYTMWHF